MVTLQSYILREMLKTFALVQLAIAIVFTLGGGIYNIVAFEGATLDQFMQFIPMLLSIVVTLTMPMAALFTATLVYGRLAADNEFTACRAAGINVHRLFLPVLLISVFTAAFTTAFANYVIPGQLRQLDRTARANICDFVVGQFRTKGRLLVPKTGLYLTAADAGVLDRAEMGKRGFPTDANHQYMRIDQPIFVQFDKDRVERFITGEWAVCQFNTGGEAIALKAIINNGQEYEIGRRAVRIERQSLDYELPMTLPDKPAFASLDRLFVWLQQPWRDTKLGEKIDEFIAALMIRRFYDYCRDEIAAGRELTLLDDAEAPHRYVISARDPTPKPGGDGRIRLASATVRKFTPGLPEPVRYVADKAEIIVKPLGADRKFISEIRLIRDVDSAVREFNPQAENPQKPILKPTLDLDGIQLPEALLTQTAATDRRAVIDRTVDLQLDPLMSDKRTGLQAAAAAVQRKVRALIHFRLAFPLSALVTVLLGAVLGVLFRGARALAAFGLAVVPFGIVLILMLMGRQLGEGPATQKAGVWVTWGSLGVMALADALVMRLGVRR